MHSDPADAATLLASLAAPDGFRGLYLRWASFFRPFEEFIFLDDYKLSAVKKKTGRKRKPKELITKEKVRPIARQFHQFLCNALKLLPDLLRRSPCNATEGDEGMLEEKATELLSIYRLCIHCLICIAPCLTGQPYSVHLQWGQLIRRLETWNKYSTAEEEGFALLETGADPQLACLITEVVIVLTYCAFKSQSKDVGVFKRILALVEQTQSWLCIMEPNSMISRHTIFIEALYRCALFVVEERKSFDDDLVYSLCLKMLKECTESPLLDRFPSMAHRICSAIDVKWDRKSSLVVDTLRMSLEISFCEKMVDLAKYVDSLLGFISNFTEAFYLNEKVKDDSELSLEVADNMQQPSEALELCCKTIWKHIQLLCQPQLTYSKSIQGFAASRDSIKGVIKDAVTKCLRIIDILHKLGASNFHEVVCKSMYELSVVEISFPNSSLCFPLTKQWIKMLCKDFSDVNEVDDAPVLYSMLLCHCPTWPKNILGEILEQELLAYDQLEAWNPALCHKMEIKVIEILLMNVFNARDFNLQRARVLLRKGLVLRTRGIESLSSSFDCLCEAISLLENATYDSFKAKTLGYHQLASAYLLRAQFTQESKKNWELIQSDIQCAINLLSELDISVYHTLITGVKPSVKNTIFILCRTLDLLSLKGFLKFHFDIYTLINFFCKYENLSLEKCLALLWTGRRLGHYLCPSPIDPDLISRISQLPDNSINSFAFWTDCLKSSSFFLLMFVQNFLISDSILNEENVQQIEDLYSCKLSVEGVKVAVSSLLLDVSAKNEMVFFAGQIYYNLAESLFAGGRVLEGLSYAKEALHLRYKVLRKKFNVSSKRPVELTESSVEASGEHDHLFLELLGSAISDVWRDIINMEKCSLSPWIILGCYLESTLQVGIFHEEIGDAVQAERLFLTGKRFSFLHSLPHFQIAFNCALGQLYRKKLFWDLAEQEFNIARKLLQENDIMISCRHCKLIFEVKIDMQIADLSTERLNKGSHVQSNALDIYRSAFRKLSNDNVEGSFIGSWKQFSICESLSKFQLEDTRHVTNNAKSHPLESDKKLLPCHICSCLENSFDSLKVEQQSSTILTVVSHGAECGESHTQRALKKPSRKGLKQPAKVASHNNKLKPQRSSRNRSFHDKNTSISAQSENYSSALYGTLDADIFSHRNSQIKEDGTCPFDGGVFTKVECLRCLCLKMIKEGTMENFIHFKWQCQRRRLLLRLLLKIAKSLEAPCEKQDAHEVHRVFWQCIFVLFDGEPCFDANFHGCDLNLFKLMGDNNIGDIFSVERAALLYNMSWFFLKDFHPEHMSTKCCSLSNVHMQDIISWLLMAFILCRQIPSLFQKVSRLIASLILLLTVEGSIPPPLCSQGSLSLSHWAAFFHQASIGSIVNYQYLSHLRDKACNFKTYKGLESENVLESETNVNYISRYAPEKLENLGEFVEDFFLGLPRISIICISLLDGDYVNLLGEMLILPSFFPAWLLITRFDGNKQPIIMLLPVDSISEEFQPKSSPCKEFIRENVVSDWPCPWSSAVIDDVAPSYKLILEANFSSLSNHVLNEAEARLNYIKWWSGRMILDNQLNNLLKAMEDKWIGPWGCLLLGERVDTKSLEIFAGRLSNSLNSQCDFIFNDNLIKVILSGAQSVFAVEACIAQSLFYKGFFGRGGCCGEQRFRAFVDRSKEVKSILTSIESLISEAMGEGMKVDRQPIILVLDSDVQMISWENMPILRKQEVYRMPSLGSILLKLNYHAREKSTFEVNLPCIDPFRAYYLLNPSGDLIHTQQQFEEWFQNHKWEGKAGNAPTSEELLLALQNHDLYLYFGHGSGMQYIRADSFGKLSSCAAAFLMGCSSGSLRQRGCYAPQGAPLHYLFAGSPAIIANLWEVSDKDIDRFAKAILNSWTQDSILHKCNKCIDLAETSNAGKSKFPSRRNFLKYAEIVEETCRFCEAKLRVASFISEARSACKLPTIIGASVVCYGVPTILKRK
ncbi:separase-like [Phalaenopsis equestris]|uniref:separase-like n=1 Tax=Phalaenopsis equestris TaxID=78828 RepID=UPI0009E2E89F|nr:separase-like [Phalaenopsis equestris]